MSKPRKLNFNEIKKASDMDALYLNIVEFISKFLCQLQDAEFPKFLRQ